MFYNSLDTILCSKYRFGIEQFCQVTLLLDKRINFSYINIPLPNLFPCGVIAIQASCPAVHCKDFKQAKN